VGQGDQTALDHGRSDDHCNIGLGLEKLGNGVKIRAAVAVGSQEIAHALDRLSRDDLIAIEPRGVSLEKGLVVRSHLPVKL
jgi:hypothetical protein